jgi:beta-ribofuranosylaminobenzene 5'-phosphate synthase
LDVIERLLLTTDGTVTPMLEHIVGERVVPTKLTQSYRPADEETRTLLMVPPGEQLLFRASELVGASTGILYVRATSVAVPHALPPQLRDGFLRGEEPIGRLLRRLKIETFREILEYDVAGEGPEAEASRRYRVYIGNVPALIIGESFLRDRLHTSTT